MRYSAAPLSVSPEKSTVVAMQGTKMDREEKSFIFMGSKLAAYYPIRQLVTKEIRRYKNGMDIPIPIEDFMEDIVGKAMRGRGVSISNLSTASGSSESAISSILKGCFDEETLRAVAPHLRLDADSLVVSGQKSWAPEPIALDGLAMFNTTWHDMHVNAFVVFDRDSKKAAIFDTGADCAPMLNFLQDEKLVVDGIFLTHTHGDHIADLECVSSATGAHVYLNPREHDKVDVGAVANDERDVIQIGALTIRTFLTSGHAVGGNTYLVEGLERPVAVVGDAVFAGSMGGGVVSYADALENNRRKILTLPDNTVICPGHGPLSTVAEEKAHNPFFPEFK